MAYLNIAVRQSVTASVTGEDATVALTASSAVAAGSTLVVIGTAVKADGLTVLLNSVADTSSNSWGTPTNVLGAGSYSPNVFVCVAENVAAATPTVTLTLNQSADVKISWALIEVENVPTSSVTETTVTGTSASASVTNTSTTTTLSQPAALAILCAGGWFGVPQNPSGWTNIQNVANGTPVGSLIAHRTLSSTDAITGSVTHEPAASVSAAMVVLNAASSGTTLRMAFAFDSTEFTNADTGITGYVWRNATPDSAAATRYTGLAGDASAGNLYIASALPAGLLASDTVYGIFYNGTDTSGLIAGTVESV
jgi:hypothetical protein